MKKRIALWLIPVLLLIITQAVFAGAATEAVTISNNSSYPVINAEPTQTPYVVYVVVTATPEPDSDDQGIIQRNDNSVSLRNNETDNLIQSIVSTLNAQNSYNSSSAANNNYYNNGSAPAVSNSNGTCCNVRLNDGSYCAMSFELVSEPTYPQGAIVPEGSVFWKEWTIRNTGTCTWTPEFKYHFFKGWQVGNTSFSMNRTTKPGETLTVRLGLNAELQPGNYYSTYIMEGPDGTQCGELTVNFSIKPKSYFAPTPTPGPRKHKSTPSPWHPGPCNPHGPWCPPPWPHW